jgi:serine/threonine protein kinase
MARRQVPKNAPSPWAIPWTDVKLEHEIGNGGFGTVFRGTWARLPVAIKLINTPTGKPLSRAAEAELLQEAQFLFRLKHPQIITVYGVTSNNGKYGVVMECMDASLFQLLHRKKVAISAAHQFQILCDVAEALLFLHTRRPPIVHADIKSPNVLLDQNLRAKVSRFVSSSLKACIVLPTLGL